jgi:Kelch motif protein
MPTPRDNLATAVLDGRVYAMGGTTPDVDTDIVEIYHRCRGMARRHRCRGRCLHRPYRPGDVSVCEHRQQLDATSLYAWSRRWSVRPWPPQSERGSALRRGQQEHPAPASPPAAKFHQFPPAANPTQTVMIYMALVSDAQGYERGVTSPTS